MPLSDALPVSRKQAQTFIRPSVLLVLHHHHSSFLHSCTRPEGVWKSTMVPFMRTTPETQNENERTRTGRGGAQSRVAIIVIAKFVFQWPTTRGSNGSASPGCGTPSSKKGLPPCNPATPQPSRDRAAATAEPRPRPPRRLLQPSSRRGEAPRRAVERKLMKFASQRSAAAPRAELPSLHYQPSAVPLIVSGLRRATLSPVRSLWSRALPCDLLASLWCV